MSATTECPTRYRTRHFFNNFTTNEDIATKFEADLPHCVRNVKEKNVLLFKFRCNIFIGIRIIKEMPGSVASGTPCIYQSKCTQSPKGLNLQPCIYQSKCTQSPKGFNLQQQRCKNGHLVFPKLMTLPIAPINRKLIWSVYCMAQGKMHLPLLEVISKFSE